MFQLYIPQPPLSYYVECLWYADDQVSYKQERILPTGTIEIMLNFGAPFRVYDHNDKTKFSLNCHAWIAGLHTNYIINEPVAETHMMGIRVKPHGLSLFVDVPAHEFHNQIIDMDLIWGCWVHELREQLDDLATPMLKFQHLEQILVDRLIPEHDTIKMLQYAIGQLRHTRHKFSMRDLSHDVGVSHKHLIHLFKQRVGVSPKALSKVFRFQSVLNGIQPNTPIHWLTIATQADYYDQAHFNREFTEFTGMSPSQYIAYRQQIYGDSLQQGESIHFVPFG